MNHRPDNEPTALYRLYDANDSLLYIGITWHPEFRLEQHLLDKEWLHLVARRTVEWYPDRPSALAAEAAATNEEKPLHDSSWRRSNKDGRPQWKNLEGRRAIIDGLRQEIRQGLHEPGSVLMTGAVAKRFGVARATASYAMQDLARKGLLQFWYHGRFRVLPTSAA
ncbi:GntR family transcriptional regulator [Streptomyces sp. NPDC057837]|uniref:GntR family transcriptional regulator n=1 Tax=Streptomyces sp. NPDC057837 TaxID=3346260 RepID=UPI0036993469